MEAARSQVWQELTFPQVVLLISSRLTASQLGVLLCVSASCRRFLLAHSSPWKSLNLQGSAKAGKHLMHLLSLPRYCKVEDINLEFAQDLEDSHLEVINCKGLQNLNLNACQNITDKGLETISRLCPHLRHFSIYWNLKITDAGVQRIVESCKHLLSLNLSGCKNITDQSLSCISKFCPKLRSLNLTRCVKLTDTGLFKIVNACELLEELYLYADPGFTRKGLAQIGKLHELKLLDLCGAQECVDECLASIVECQMLLSLNLTWCTKVTDHGIKALAKNCRHLQTLSLHGLLGVTDDGIQELSKFCSATLTTLDVNGCRNIKKRSKHELLQLFPRLACFKVHS